METLTQLQNFCAENCLYSQMGWVVIFLVLAFNGAPLWLNTLAIAGALACFTSHPLVWTVFLVAAVVMNVPQIRRIVLSFAIFKTMRSLGIIPQISDTERAALNAGDVWLEGELFSGKPRLGKFLEAKYPYLTKEEQAFLEGPVESLCKMTSDYEVWQKRDLSPEAWDFIKKNRFLGMIIPKEYGGLGFTALAHSEVIQKISSRSVAAAINVMVPNSLGPAELLIHYGTEAQKKHYLPRLATGQEIPCFALTEPGAGSDAASIQASGEVFKGDDGKLYLRLNWNKRWITLAAISTVLGLAFRLRDPKNLLGKGEDLGITCALIPSATKGVELGKRHDPLGVPFFNCPTRGKDVVVPIDAIIGGLEMAGKGWNMLMECLAAGRGISLPAQCTGGAKFATLVASAHSVVRKQFGLSIGKFEGIVEVLARMVGTSYILEATRRFTLGALDSGIKPPVITAIAKYQFTEAARRVINDGMDIVGGAGISRGPRNLLANGYISTPISITVEGANILTRTLIIFGQGALRAHPFARKEVEAIEKGDLAGFDKAFWGHVGIVIRNGVRSVLLSLSRGYFSCSPRGGVTRRYYQKLVWVSAVFAFMTDIAMAALGGKLKTKEKLTGRFADILSWMYLIAATLRRFEADGRPKEDEPVLRWSMDYGFSQIQRALDGLYTNLKIPGFTWLFQGPVRWCQTVNPMGTHPGDDLEFNLAELIQKNTAQRKRLLYEGVFVPETEGEPLHRLTNAFQLTLASEDVARKIRSAVKSKKLKKAPFTELIPAAVQAGVVSQSEADIFGKAEAARWDAIQVDEYDVKEYLTVH